VSANDAAAAAWEDYINQQQEAEIEKLQDRIKQLEREVQILRLYGNKDCTAMADEALTKETKQ
jgi:hypothetical protein